MADFCQTCSVDMFGTDTGDFAGIVEPGVVMPVICEGCGPVYVESDGSRAKGLRGWDYDRLAFKFGEAMLQLDHLKIVAARANPEELPALRRQYAATRSEALAYRKEALSREG